jgi:hypothetical protein
MAGPPTAVEIKEQIKILLTPVLPKTLIIPYWILTADDAGKIDVEPLRSSLDPISFQGSAEFRVNGLMISEAAFLQNAPVVHDATRRVNAGMGTNVITRHFRLWYFFQDPTGQQNENQFSANVEIMRTTLNRNRKLGFADTVSGIAGPGAWIDGHDKLQGPLMLPESMGSVITFVFEGRLSVRVREALSGT